MYVRSGLLVLCLLGSSMAALADQEPRTISVSGTGTVDAAPDIARLRLAVQRRDLRPGSVVDLVVEDGEADLVLHADRLPLLDQALRYVADLAPHC